MGIARKILIVDDEPEALENCRRILSRLQYDCLTESDPARAIDVIARERPGLVLTDLRMPGLNGLDILTAAKRLDPEVHVVLLTAYATIQTAVASMRRGAFDYLSKPFTSEELIEVTRQAFGTERPERLPSWPHRSEPEDRPTPDAPPQILGQSRAIRQVQALLQKVARADITVMIYGEIGTGKELVARTIHSQSHRAARPLVAVDCVAFPETQLESELFGHEKGAFPGARASKPGAFELAVGGTVFLDEVSALSPKLQSRLQRVLQERRVRRMGGTSDVEVDARVIASSKHDLERACCHGEFREDLYYHLNTVPISLPPLRHREGDIQLLTQEFFQRFARPAKTEPGRSPTLDPRALEALARYSWPGNVRELQTVIERALAMADGPVIGCEHLPTRLRGGPSPDTFSGLA